MGGTMSRNKGKRGEREVIDMLQPVVTQVREELGLPEVLLKRNTLQSDGGGCDVAGLMWLAIEVKLHAKPAVGGWWAQTLRQAGAGCEPVLAYRCNRQPWRFRLWASLGQGVVVAAEVGREEFLMWFRRRLMHECLREMKNGE